MGGWGGGGGGGGGGLHLGYVALIWRGGWWGVAEEVDT